MSKHFQGNLMLLIASLIWGSAFVAQSAGMDYVGPFTYTMVRSFIGFLVLVPVTLFFRKRRNRYHPLTAGERDLLNKNSVIGGIFCGMVLSVASNFQQVGISTTTAGKAGFITALYIVIVPILGILLGKKVAKIIWVYVFIAMAGFYLLCIKEGFSIGKGDFLCLLCAFSFSVHIMVIDHFSTGYTDGIMISCVQFLVAGLISLVLTFLFETPSISSIWAAKITILYAGVLSSGVAFTLQIMAQRNTDPVIAPLIMSMESVFAVFFGWLILHESMTLKEMLGCIIVFTAVVLAQLPAPATQK
ncbi:DMT family transporter [Oribacterium sp. WCC10]|uniref:DMT family transporter n=1 Tax=Oribacterium sp. WCC10 TaxID=1855343 RepID=UPI0008F06F7E|nr:DMT family transporter [Oribacterium sp. WCC10]SFG68458.1 Threonine/homoserine efflux transporter RhtA [Oribacterium sp. WCC10]